jgi:hypothetical protein
VDRRVRGGGHLGTSPGEWDRGIMMRAEPVPLCQCCY